VTPGVALAYAVMAAGLYALGKTSPSESYSSHPELSAAPAE
jgi:AGZA family xanthine/uracil permease-like MFS transporter